MYFFEKILGFPNEITTDEVDFSRLSSLGCTLPASSGGVVLFEENVTISSSLILGGDSILVGSNTYINNLGYVKGKVVIGRYCSIGRRVSIAAGSHLFESVSTSPALYGMPTKAYSDDDLHKIGARRTKSGTTYIGHDVWIGDGVVITPGVKIGSGCVIGANAVVTSDCPPYSIIGGSPSRIIRKRFTDEVIDKLISLDIYEVAHSTLSAAPMRNVLEFIEYSEMNKLIKHKLNTYLFK